MALKLGELVAYLKADDTALDRGIKAARTKLQQAGESIRQQGPVIGAALAAGIGAGLLQGMELDKARARLAAQVGDPALARQLGEVAGAVYARGFGESAAQSMQTVRDIMQAGLVPKGDAAALEDLTVKAQAYADTWGTEVAEAVSTASVLVKSGIAKDATHALDLLTVAAGKVPLAMVGDLQEVSAEYAQFFRGLGFSGEQTFALLAAGADKGKWGIDKVGDAIKEFSILATELDGAPADALKSLGFNASKMQKDLLAGGDTARAAFDRTIDALLRVKDPAQQAQLAMDLFGTPLEDLNKADIPEFLKSLDQAGAGLGDVSGAAAKAGKAFEDSASQKLTAFKRQVQSALVEKLAEALPYIEKTFGWLSRNSGWVGPLATGLGVLAGIIGLVVLGTKAWAAAQIALNIAMMLNPVGLIILAVIGLIAVIVGLWMKFEGFRNFWKAVWDGIVAAFQWAVDWIVGGWTWVLETIVALAKGWWELFTGFWGMVGQFFADLLKGWWDLFTGFWSMVGNGIVDAWNWVVGKVSAFVDYVGGLGGRIRAKAKGMWDGIKDAFKSAVNWIIGKWNSLSFRIPPVSVPGLGQVWGGATLSTPNIPMLAKGGHILGSGTAIVGERGPELVHLGRGATVQPLASGSAMAGLLRLLISGEFRVRGSDLVLVLRDQVASNGGDVQAVIGSST
ncbi:phage tail tape measure protein [Micromonospora echinospora]